MAKEGSWDIAVPLAALLEQRGWSQTKVAEAAALKRTDVTRMLRVPKKPTDPKVLRVGRVRAQRIADALGVTGLDLGLPPEEGDAEALSLAHRLAQLEAEVGWLKGWLSRGFAALGVPPELRGEEPQAQADGDSL